MHIEVLATALPVKKKEIRLEISIFRQTEREREAVSSATSQSVGFGQVSFQLFFVKS